MKSSADDGEVTATAARPGTVDYSAAPPLAPPEPAIDFEHLAGMTLGESKLERELLMLFERQMATLIAHMANQPQRVIAGLAHTLCGSARGVGAWKVAEAAEALERLAMQPGPAALSGALDRLTGAVADAQAQVADHLRSD